MQTIPDQVYRVKGRNDPTPESPETQGRSHPAQPHVAGGARMPLLKSLQHHSRRHISRAQKTDSEGTVRLRWPGHGSKD